MNNAAFGKKSIFKKSVAALMCLLMLLSIFPFDVSVLKTTASAASANSQSAGDADADADDGAGDGDDSVDKILNKLKRVDLSFNNNWKFLLGDPIGAMAKAFDDSSWETVKLPHDFSITQEFTNNATEVESGNLPVGTGWYRKMFTMPAEYSNKEIYLNFDGVYNNAYIYVNGNLVAENHYGYNSFSIDIGKYLICNGNTWNLVAVKVDSEMASSRWYPGSGIYRDVTMTVTNPVHVSKDGVYVTTPKVTESEATVSAQVTVENTLSVSKTFNVVSEILSPGGAVVATDKQEITVDSKDTATTDLSFTVQNPQLWDTENPNLYTLHTFFESSDSRVADIYDINFGIRTLEWKADTGFYLNGKSTKILGMCLHHDQGALGAAQEYDAIYRQVKILKEMGCNAIRTSHNPGSRILIEICNKLGMLVMEEFFDDWDSPKSGNNNDFSKYFSRYMHSKNELVGASEDYTWARFVVEQTMKRDRNDPSVIMWSIGNELWQAPSKTNYVDIAIKMQKWVKDLDSTRPITQGNDQSKILSVDDYVDVIGANYHPEKWVALKANGTLTKPFVATETVSAITSRGTYSYSSDRQGGKVSTTPYALYSYDNSYVQWGSSAATTWYYTAANDWFSGEFVWTGFDYIGEPTPWNNNGKGSSTVPNSAYFGVVDTAGFPKDQYYLYRSWWQNKDTTLHLLPGTWNKDNLYLNNGYAYVNVYSNADRIELLLNGNVIGTAQSTLVTTANGYQYRTWTETAVDSQNCNTDEIFSGTGHELYAQFGVKYAEGTLSVKAYDAAGNEITDTVGTNSVTSGKSATQIVSNIWDDDDFTADGDSFAYVEFKAVDEDGNFVNDYNGTLSVSVSKDGKIAGVDNGFQGTTSKFQQPSVLTSDTTATIQMFNGRALAIVQTTLNPNDITVTATTDDALTVVGTTFTSKPETGAKLTDEFEEFVLQSVTPYEADVYDRFDMVEEEYAQLDSLDSTIHYNYFKATSQGTVQEFLPTGDYYISGFSANSGDPASCGTMTHKTITTPKGEKGLVATGKNAKPNVGDDMWHFERLDNGKYYISFTDDDGTVNYLNIGTTAGDMTLSDQPQEFIVSVSEYGVYVGNGTQYVNYYGSTNPRNVISTYADGTCLRLYTKTADGTDVKLWSTAGELTNNIENGKYALYCLKKVLTNKTKNSGSNKGLDLAGAEVQGDKLLLQEENYYTFTKVPEEGEDCFYIQSMDGQYLTIGNANGNLTLSSEKSIVKVFVLESGEIMLYNDDEQFLDLWRNEQMISSWTGSTSTIQDNRSFTLYEKDANSGNYNPAAYELYHALTKAMEYQPGSYGMTGYEEFLNAVEEGIRIYKDSTSTNSQKTAAAAKIMEKIDVLTISVKKFPARLIKYGYDPDSTTNPYDGGSLEYNAQNYEQFVEAIWANENLMSQIKDVIDYDGKNGTVWAKGYNDNALSAAVRKYAKLYSLAFIDNGVTGGIAEKDYYRTAWNHWSKDGTKGVGETQEEGASIQGLYSKWLGPDGYPIAHTAYNLGSGLSYLSGSPSTYVPGQKDYLSFDIAVDSSTTKTIKLPALNNISVFVPDFFSPNNVEGTQYDYTKFYWNTDFPFIVTTDKNGVNQYVYDSSSDTYMFRAKYDDETQTAVSGLYEQSDWKVKRQNEQPGKGFFPFNYQITDDNEDEVNDRALFEGENAIYHFGMSFETDFYIPQGGKYTKGGEDIVFNFSGDDDVLVYVDNVLVLDNGGLHGARTCSINFTTASVSYQYAWDIEHRTLLSTEENAASYTYGAENEGISYENQVAIDYLNKVRNDGEKHTFSFFYLERGSTESNCKISFNLQQVSEHVSLNDQTLVADFGLPLKYNIKDNNTMSETAIQNGATVEYIGVTDSIEKAVVFTKPDYIDELSRAMPYKWSGKHGNYIVDAAGNFEYQPTTMEFVDSDSFYICAEVKNDPTYASGTVYYAFEKVTIIPATNIYFEEDFMNDYSWGINYHDGTVPDSFDNSTLNYGKWTTETLGEKAAYQAADLVGDINANKYGYDSAYDNSTGFSNGTAKKVTVSTKNNPNSKYSGGSGASWPTVNFTFKGTGFDVLGVTDNTTGIFTVEIYEGEGTSGKRVKRSIVDTYYGFSYARIYLDSNGQPTSTVTDVPAYWTKGNHFTTKPTYYDVNGVISAEVHYLDVSGKGYTKTPTYYDEDGNLTTEKTENPAYSYAYGYGWIKDANSSTDSLYQIPVISVEDLPYKEYTAVITPTFSTLYGHYNEDKAGDETIKSYNLYVDGIRIYNPAGVGDDISDRVVLDSYKTDDEGYPNYLELRNMIIGADSFGDKDSQHGVIFIDGIPALDNDVEKYKKAGPNNELYLSSGQAVAFEIWATAVPSDIQIFAKSAKGSPTLKFSYDGQNIEKTINSATQMAYSYNQLLPVGHKLKWTQVTANGRAYYTSGTLVVANASSQDSVLSLGKMKWTFDVAGAQGHFRIPTETTTEELTLMSTKTTLKKAFSSVSALYTSTAIANDDLILETKTPSKGDNLEVYVTTSDDVKKLLVKDKNGNLIEPVSVEQISSDFENDKVMWKVTLSCNESGKFVYTVTGVNEYDLEGTQGATFTVTVENPPTEEETQTFLQKLQGFFKKIAEFFERLLSIFK